MISLHAGRLLLTCERASQTWHARINIGPKPEHQMVVDTGTVDLRQAMERGNMHYQAFRAKVRPVTPDAKVMCWDCLHWTPGGRGRCELDIPEARQTGGRFAPNCSVFMPCQSQR
jgi:hypothetical protein